MSFYSLCTRRLPAEYSIYLTKIHSEKACSAALCNRNTTPTLTTKPLQARRSCRCLADFSAFRATLLIFDAFYTFK